MKEEANTGKRGEIAKSVFSAGEERVRWARGPTKKGWKTPPTQA